MRYKSLGRTGLNVSEICLGTLTFRGDEAGSGERAGQIGQIDAEEFVKIAFDAGVNFFDTANVYAKGRSEQILGHAIKSLGLRREEVIIASKASGPVRPGPNGSGASLGHIESQISSSLRRLGTDYIDLYQVHGFDVATPIEETLYALDSLVRRGLVRYIGVSNWAAWQVSKAIGIATWRNYAPVASLQSYYCLAGRDVEREIIPMSLAEGVGLLAWGPLAGGFLSGKYAENGEGEGRRAHCDFPPLDVERSAALVALLRKIAADKRCTVAQIAIAWLLRRPAVASVIIGASRSGQLIENLASVAIELTAAELELIGKASTLKPEYPGWMFERHAAHRGVHSPRPVPAIIA